MSQNCRNTYCIGFVIKNCKLWVRETILYFCSYYWDVWKEHNLWFQFGFVIFFEYVFLINKLWFANRLYLWVNLYPKNKLELSDYVKINWFKRSLTIFLEFGRIFIKIPAKRSVTLSFCDRLYRIQKKIANVKIKKTERKLFL